MRPVTVSYEPVPVQRRHKRFGLFYSELCLLAAAVVCRGLYELLGVPLHNIGRLFLERAGSLFSYYLIALPLALLFTRLSELRRSNGVPPIRATVARFQAEYLQRGALFRDIRALFGCVALFVLFIELKHLTPFLRSSVLDRFFLRQESRMFGGELLSEKVFQFFGPGVAPLFSEGYFFFYPYIAILIYLFVLERDERKREQFFLGFVLCWLIGVFLIYLIPTLGPVYVEGRFFQSIPSCGVQDMQLKLLQMRESVLQGGRGVHLISGFPSLHVALTTYGTAMLWWKSRWLSALSSVVWGITLVTTLYFGWHYFLDDLGGFALGLGLALTIRKYFRPFYILRQRIG